MTFSVCLFVSRDCEILINGVCGGKKRKTWVRGSGEQKSDGCATGPVFSDVAEHFLRIQLLALSKASVTRGYGIPFSLKTPLWLTLRRHYVQADEAALGTNIQRQSERYMPVLAERASEYYLYIWYDVGGW